MNTTMKRRAFTVLIVIILAFTISVVPVAAYSEDAEDTLGTCGEELSRNNFDVNNEEPEASTRGYYIREFVRYDPSANNVNYKYTPVGSVIGQNNTSQQMTIYFYYQTSNTVTSSISLSSQAEVSKVIEILSISTGLTATYSKSWTQGMNSGASVTLQAGTSARIDGYIPGITTRGSLVYWVYQDCCPNSGYYDYVSLPSTYFPVNMVYVEANRV